MVLDAPEATFLLSSLAIALSNCGSDLPAFVPVHDPTRKAYYGIRGTKTFSMRYETDRLGSRIPVEYMHLEGLYNIFNTKVAFGARPADFSQFDVEITMKLTYRTPMPGFKFFEANAEPILNYDGDMLEELAWDEDCAWAEWHSVEDPVKGYELICTWNKRSLKDASEAAEFEKLSATQADKWALTIVKHQTATQENDSAGFTGRLRALVNAFHVSSQAHFVEEFAADAPSVKHVTHHHMVPPPTVLERVIKDLFEDESFEDQHEQSNHRSVLGVKAAPTDSLFSRFCLHALRFGTCNIRAIAVLWIDFVREVRWCWDEGYRLPRVSVVHRSPDLESCILHQKLQMLALCIEEKALQGVSEKVDNSHAVQDLTVNGTKETGTKIELFSEDPDSGRKGSAGPVGKLMLLKANRSLHAPLTQKLPVFTEDMLEEREQTLSTLRNWDNFTRIRHQRNVLASDMAAFKAANPGAVLEDFMQWYSYEKELHPVDFGEGYLPGFTEQDEAAENGKPLKTLSHPDNVDIWDSVDACAAFDQKPLFDYTREAEKVLHYLETIRPHLLLAQMLACSFAVAAHTLDRSVNNLRVATLTWELEELSASMESVLPSLEDSVKFGYRTPEEAADWQNKILQLCAVFQRVEENVILATSLGKKLGSAPRLLAALINHHIEPHKVPVARVFVEKAMTSNRWKDTDSSDERKVVASLFTILNSDASWQPSSSMGHLLNGHEPAFREVILFYPSNLEETLADLEEHQPEQVYSHRMYVHGTLNEIQVAHVVASID